ncbi:TetR family transcriptional regulator [Sphingomonas sp. TF3]|uniref:TetR/AcrR family transcriptional regulator n=1 Tax=Sphingomonas sp. TF3 TaxID=2495580 RepID=UPI000F879E71|nr:TetR/AcrR family transcriptional regulator [Sphingomonas sp. TF3]RUN78316.1 TetR family transcriptional regulator [Sphingomonas sp. TF3]
MSLREKKKDRTRLQLLEAALALIARQGFAETTINQIAAAVDVSPRTLLRYFPTKEDVIVSWVEEGQAVFRAALVEQAATQTIHLALLASARAMLAHYQAREDFYLAIERVIATSPGISARKQEMTASLSADVTEILAGLSCSDLRTLLYPAVIFAMVKVAFQSWVATDGDTPLLVAFDEAARLIDFHERSATAAEPQSPCSVGHRPAA